METRNATLKRIRLKGYRSIKEIDLELGPLNVLIGANGSGKSNFISFLNLLYGIADERLQLRVAVAGRAESLLHFGAKVTSEIDAELEFDSTEGQYAYRFRLTRTAGDALAFAEESLKFSPAPGKNGMAPEVLRLGEGHAESKLRQAASEGSGAARSIWAALKSCRVFHFHDTSATAGVRRYSRIADNRQLTSDGSNLSAMLYAYRQVAPIAYRRIVSAIGKILPEFDDFVLEPDRLNSTEILLNWRKRDSDYIFGPHQFSDGTLRAMSILTLFLQPQRDLPELIVLDEPELGLHPYAVEIVQGVIRAAAISSQVVLATQSPSFIENLAPEEILVTETAQGGSTYSRLESAPLAHWLEDYTLGELWQQNVLGGGPLK